VTSDSAFVVVCRFVRRTNQDIRWFQYHSFFARAIQAAISAEKMLFWRFLIDVCDDLKNLCQ
jgi:hypothetical protein